jgi:hypothetical protein
VCFKIRKKKSGEYNKEEEEDGENFNGHVKSSRHDYCGGTFLDFPQRRWRRYVNSLYIS